MILLGFNGDNSGAHSLPESHDSAAALVVDGEVIAAAEEERFNRKKHTDLFPARAIAYCLAEAGVRLEDVDAFCFYWDPALEAHHAVHLEAGYAPSRWVLQRLHRLVEHQQPFELFRKHFGFEVPAPRRRWVPHHVCHAASAFYCSEFDSAAYLTVDANGEQISLTYGRADAEGLHPLDALELPSSLGRFYSHYTALLGFTQLEDEYKVMGLAAYGSPERFRALFREHWKQTSRGVDAPRGAAVNRAMLELNRFRREPNEPITRDHEDLAAALQECLEEQILHLGRVVRKATGERHLCLAGGVALNSTANGKLARSGMFERIFIQPAAYDAGNSVGAALYEYHRAGKPRRPRRFRAYLGPAFDARAIDGACERYARELVITTPSDVVEAAAERLAQGQVLGWFQGRMEFGPRALGNRSILGDVREEGMRERINRVVKHREPFRPFAPAVPLERASEFFELGGVAESPYMLMTFPVRPEQRHRVPAIVHRDGTARVQTVTEADNPRFWALLHAFGRRTGVPVLLNTSFNLRGEPIVCAPEDAIECFLSTEMDALVLGDRLLTRRPQEAREPGWLEARPVLNEGVELRTRLVPGRAGVEAQGAVVSWRHLSGALPPEDVTLLLACDGRRTVRQLLEEQGAGLPPEEARARQARTEEALQRLSRLRVLRML